MKKLTALFLAVILALSFVSGAFAEALLSTETAPGGLYGKPWVTTYDSGNLPAERTSAADDLNIYVNFDVFDAHRDDIPAMQGMLGDTDEPRRKLMELIADENVDYPGLDQLRIFYRQAADLDTIDAQGIEPVRPYLDRIDAAKSIEELNAVLTAGDFPFLPFLTLSLSCRDMRGVNIFTLYPHFLIGDSFNAEYYAGKDTLLDAFQGMTGQLLARGALTYLFPGTSIDLLETRIEDFERAYGRFALSTTREMEVPYGKTGELCSYLTCDELSERLPRFPVAGMLKKEGCDPSLPLKIPCIEWMEALDSVWTEDHLELIRIIAEVSIIVECSNYLATDISTKSLDLQDLFDGIATETDDPDQLSGIFGNLRPDADEHAYDACASLSTFNQLLAAVYVDQVIGNEIKDQLNALADELISAYEPIFAETAWMSDSSRANVMEKLHAMRKCILEPDGGFYDFSGLQLVPTEEGGTVFENYLRVKAYLRDLRNGIAGTPARAVFAWDALGPMTANCFYDGDTNSINIMPGFMTSAITEKLGTREEMMGCIGAIIAHEISHGFDFAGSQTNAYGMYETIFDEEDRADYLAAVDRLVQYYDTIEIAPDVYVDGNNVKVEAAADLCGMQVALRVAGDEENFDYERFFETYAHMYADVMPENSAVMMAASDPHPLSHLRINVNAQMFDEFYKTYGVKEGDGMYLAPEARLRIFD